VCRRVHQGGARSANEKEKQKSHDHFSDVLNLSRQIGAYRFLLKNLLMDMEEKNPII
jgi:hypothetical protein